MPHEPNLKSLKPQKSSVTTIEFLTKNYDDIVAARKRGCSCVQIASELNLAGYQVTPRSLSSQMSRIKKLKDDPKPKKEAEKVKPVAIIKAPRLKSMRPKK